MSNWFVLDKNGTIFADVEEEDEARELAIIYVIDPWTEDAAPFKVMSYDEYVETNLV
jgi:hypothetical protein